MAIAVALVGLLAVLATLQYRWVADVSRAERDRLQASLRTRGAEVAAAVDRDLSRTFVALQVDAVAFERDRAAALADAATRAASTTSTGAAIREIYVAEPGDAGSLQRLDRQSRALEHTNWPPELTLLRGRLDAMPRTAVPGLPLLPGRFDNPVDGDLPGFIVPVTPPVPRIEPQPGDVIVKRAPIEEPWHAIIVWLDRDQVRSRLIAPLVAQQFGDALGAEFNVAVINRSDRRTIYRSGAPVDLAATDFTSDLFALRLGDLVWAQSVRAADDAAGERSAPMKDRVSLTIVRRGATDEGADASPTAAHTVRQGATWTLALQAKQGSLDAVIARSRARNLAVSLGVLGVLGAGLALLLVAGVREQRIARQQLEFVASVSHELRTPLAVIRSAAENLADGVVAPDSVPQYAALIRSEGRRLSDMVERVMDFAGMSAGTLIRNRRSLDARDIVDRAVATASADAAEQGIGIDVHGAPGVGRTVGDADALASALHNALANAVKYSRPGSRVEVDVASSGDTLRIAVSDRGIGIDDEDIPHVFEPFFRGRRAVDSQVRGSGVGLSVVQKIVDAHGGHVRVAPRHGGGTVLTIELPAAPPQSEEA